MIKRTVEEQSVFEVNRTECGETVRIRTRVDDLRGLAVGQANSGVCDDQSATQDHTASLNPIEVVRTAKGHGDGAGGDQAAGDGQRERRGSVVNNIAVYESSSPEGRSRVDRRIRIGGSC